MITDKAHQTIIAIIEDSREYDAETVVIHADGSVTAQKDANKTFAGNDDAEYLVANVRDMVDAEGNRREGW